MYIFSKGVMNSVFINIGIVYGSSSFSYAWFLWYKIFPVHAPREDALLASQ